MRERLAPSSTSWPSGSSRQPRSAGGEGWRIVRSVSWTELKSNIRTAPPSKGHLQEEIFGIDLSEDGQAIP